MLRASRCASGEDRTYLTELRNGVLHHGAVADSPNEATTFTLTRLALIGLVTGALDLSAALQDGTVAVDGDVGVLGQLLEVLTAPDPSFEIVLPCSGRAARGHGVASEPQTSDP